MAVDLSKDRNIEVHLADIDKAKLAQAAAGGNITTVPLDISDRAALAGFLADKDLVLSAVPGFMGYQTLKTIIESGKDAVDIAFFPEDPFSLDDLARKKGVSVLVDFGVAPGLSNILIGSVHYNSQYTSKAVIYVGGLPAAREWPYEYKAVFSPADVLEEYTRPARIVRNGKQEVVEALSEIERIDFPGVGTLEAFISDGLRTLVKTIDATEMREKTLRYPGHAKLMEILRYTGFFNKEEIEINGHRISPLDFTSALLFQKWKLNRGEKDITLMRIIVEGVEKGEIKRHQFDLHDEYDLKTSTHSMARVTGYTATMGIRLLIRGKIKQKGIIPPEYIGRNKAEVNFVLDGLKKRGITISKTVDILEDSEEKTLY
jgi:saccharopine dehydrogenase-like NADP-dependent oxidoreductase